MHFCPEFLPIISPLHCIFVDFVGNPTYTADSATSYKV
jgi:hypothetical protein